MPYVKKHKSTFCANFSAPDLKDVLQNHEPIKIEWLILQIWHIEKSVLLCVYMYCIYFFNQLLQG